MEIAIPPAAVTSKSKTNAQNTADLFIYFCSFTVPRRLPHQHGPVQLALDVGVAGATGVHEGVHGHQHEALSVEVPHLDRELPHRGQAQHRGHRGHLCSQGRGRGGDAGGERSKVTDG